MILICTESFTVGHGKVKIVFEKDKTYLLSVKECYVTYWYEGKYYEVPTQDVMNKFESVIKTREDKV